MILSGGVYWVFTPNLNEAVPPSATRGSGVWEFYFSTLPTKLCRSHIDVREVKKTAPLIKRKHLSKLYLKLELQREAMIKKLACHINYDCKTIYAYVRSNRTFRLRSDLSQESNGRIAK